MSKQEEVKPEFEFRTEEGKTLRDTIKKAFVTQNVKAFSALGAFVLDFAADGRQARKLYDHIITTFAPQMGLTEFMAVDRINSRERGEKKDTAPPTMEELAARIG